jgi:hypothetical protein
MIWRRAFIRFRTPYRSERDISTSDNSAVPSIEVALLGYDTGQHPPIFKKFQDEASSSSFWFHLSAVPVRRHDIWSSCLLMRLAVAFDRIEEAIAMMIG